ncbi:hypothetical protein M413DRAFT_6825 [Hebeloma cylindrosporum]|uniref:DUF3669 domain-containing protein n=1 Tax=Hebeloma cylindrosporum TaxID=76867 RepID=A0A0C3CTR9_HEBCY|nr:hypothetical protein M413DRAFT_6825 [Hebeloma cylindrosporum h7]
MSFAHDFNPECKISIGMGSFATAFILAGRPVAFKNVISSGRTPELKAEFEALRHFYDVCNDDSFFALPRPLAYYDPAVPTSFVSADVSPIPKGRSRRHALVYEGDFKALELDRAAYAMDQVLPIPLSIARNIRKLFYPEGQEKATVPCLCRLYFGKEIETTPLGGRPSRFFNSSNFPLDVSRYTRIMEAAPDEYHLSVDDIVYGMGDMLGRLHWLGGYDGRDVEFVMGGASISGITVYTIDFNQLRPWSREKNEIHLLVEAFFINDPYYPRPRPEDARYQKFCLDYLEAYPKESKEATELAQSFLHAIETEQAKRDSAVCD